MILDNKADIEIRTINGESTLHMACKKGHKDIVNILLNRQANINLRTKKMKNTHDFIHSFCDRMIYGESPC